MKKKTEKPQNINICFKYQKRAVTRACTHERQIFFFNCDVTRTQTADVSHGKRKLYHYFTRNRNSSSKSFVDTFF